jgi:hypothetical protein
MGYTKTKKTKFKKKLISKAPQETLRKTKKLKMRLPTVGK